ncbi:MAG TPA: DNA recombination protein RmuC [Caulobacteraceae bacterium]|nr:DNA recombination protein RmuC [Caulobacteraceae bacterium]
MLELLAAFFALAFAGALFMWQRERGMAMGLKAELNAAGDRIQAQEEARAAMGEFLKAQATQSAHTVAEEMVKRADESFKNREQLAQARLEAQLKPVAETLAKFEKQVQDIEKVRAEETGGLKQQITALMEASMATQVEARKLSAALRRGAGVQGRWGEQMLRNVLEMAGLVARIDFEEQASTDCEEGRRRPDVIVRLPGGGVFVIDAKCSLNAYLEAQDAADEAAREAGYLRHTQSVRGHIQGLSQKAYWDQFDASPDFVAMFVPGDGFLAAALERSPELMTEAMEKKVILVTPSTLFALCKAVAYGWRVEKQALNAAHIATLGRDLYKRIAVMGGYVSQLGKGLETAVAKYNQFVGSLETQVMSQARKFEDLKVDHEGKELPQLEAVETGLRPLAKLAVVDDAPLAAVSNQP